MRFILRVSETYTGWRAELVISTSGLDKNSRFGEIWEVTITCSLKAAINQCLQSRPLMQVQKKGDQSGETIYDCKVDGLTDSELPIGRIDGGQCITNLFFAPVFEKR